MYVYIVNSDNLFSLQAFDRCVKAEHAMREMVKDIEDWGYVRVPDEDRILFKSPHSKQIHHIRIETCVI